MELTKSNNNESTILKISNKLSIYDMGNLHQELQSAFDTAQEITIDLAETESCDSAAIQLMISAHKTAIEKNLSFIVSNPNEEITNFATNLGFDLKGLNYQPTI